MLGRRILRIKAFKVLYGYAVTGNMSLAEALENWMSHVKRLGTCICSCFLLYLR